MKVYLMCHAPIVIPEIAGARLSEIETTSLAMQAIARRVVANRPDGIVIVSPHMPRFRREYGIRREAALLGDFGDFGFSELKIEVKGASDFAEELKTAATLMDVPLKECAEVPLDHGTMVPLYFINRQGWKGPTMVVGLPMESNLPACIRLGEAINAAAKERGERWTVVISGDMSHRLTPEAPAGFHPRGKEFDRWIIENLQANDFDRVLMVDPELRRAAGEDVLESLAVAWGALGKKNRPNELISYEAPFGVGYLIADLNIEEVYFR